MEIIALSAVCSQCQNKMTLTSCNDRSDGYKWQCRKSINGKRHKVEASIRKGSWFDNSNMTLTEIIKFTYWWCVGLDQTQITLQLKLSPNTAVDWTMFCREVCLTTIENKREKIGGKGKTVQIDESKVGKRKYHRGHYVEANGSSVELNKILENVLSKPLRTDHKKLLYLSFKNGFCKVQA